MTFNINRGDGNGVSYCQLFRSGQIETNYAQLISVEEGKPNIISFSYYEERLIETLVNYLSFYETNGIFPPFIVYISLIGVLGSQLYHKRRMPVYQYERDMMLLPDILIEDKEQKFDYDAIGLLLKPAFDIVWNAFGHPQSPNYTQDGKRKKE